MKKIAALIVMWCCVWVANAQQPAANISERRVPLNETAVAFDADGVAALEANLRTTTLSGAPDSPVTNVRFVVKNSSTIAYSYVSGLVTFYDAAGIRCGEGIFKADILAANESFETDTPGARIRCEVVTWRVVATHLIPRTPPSPAPIIP